MATNESNYEWIIPQEEIKDASLKEIYKAAVNYGESVALSKASDAPVVGERFESFLNNEEVIETADEAKDEFVKFVVVNESENRQQFLNAELWIATINSRDDSEKVWEKLEEGIVKGITNIAEQISETWEEEEEFFWTGKQISASPN